MSEFTKSRARHTNDNALVESKNGSVVRKHLGYSHIPRPLRPAGQRLHPRGALPLPQLPPPLLLPTETIDAKGRQRKRYRYENMMTPYEKLASLPNVQAH